MANEEEGNQQRQTDGVVRTGDLTENMVSDRSVGGLGGGVRAGQTKLRERKFI